jgi:hypothetical protein
MGSRKNIPTALRQAVWEAHGRRCAYTGEPVGWNELDIDHVIPVGGDLKRIAELKSSGILGPEFNINGLENLLPTKRHRNSAKSDSIANDGSVTFYLNLAAQKKTKAESIYASANSSDRALNGYLQLKLQAEKNDISIDDMIAFTKHQADGEVPLRISPEIDGVSISSANSSYAPALMDKPFALGGGSITEVVLQNDADEVKICTTANEFLTAKSQGFWALTQYDITCSSVAEQTAELLRAVKDCSYATFSEIRSPLINFKALDRWASTWVTDCFFERDMDYTPYRTIASLIDAELVEVKEQSEWHLVVDSLMGFSILLRELMRGDLDGDNKEEILVFCYISAKGGTLRAGGIWRAKMSAEGLLISVDC